MKQQPIHLQQSSSSPPCHSALYLIHPNSAKLRDVDFALHEFGKQCVTQFAKSLRLEYISLYELKNTIERRSRSFYCTSWSKRDVHRHNVVYCKLGLNGTNSSKPNSFHAH